MQTLKRIAHFVWKVLLLESALLIVIAIFWRWTNWHTTTDYGAALAASGGIMILSGLLAIASRGSSADMHLRRARMTVPGWDSQHQHRYTSTYTKSTRVWFWLINLGIITVGIGIVFRIFFF